MQVMKKCKTKMVVLLITLSLFCIYLAGCSGVSEEEYQALQEQLSQSELQVTEKEAELEELTDKFNESQADNLVLKQYLSSTYDGYRYMLVNITTEVYGDGLSKTEWENFITTYTSDMPTFDQVSEAVK